MAELSPQAQAVLDAFRTSHTGQGCLAAALRAAVLQAVPQFSTGENRAPFAPILAIAAELEGATRGSSTH